MRWYETPPAQRGPAPEYRRYSEQLGWWLWNPGGKMILDIGGVDFTTLVVRMDERADDLFASREALRIELRPLMP